MLAVSERAIKYFIENCKVKAKFAMKIYREETICSICPFLHGIMEYVTCVTPSKAEMNFQTSHFVASGLFW